MLPDLRGPDAPQIPVVGEYFKAISLDEAGTIEIYQDTGQTVETSTNLFSGFRIGSWVQFNLWCTLTSTGNANKLVSVRMSRAWLAFSGPDLVGSMSIFDTSAGSWYHGHARSNPGTYQEFYAQETGAASAGGLGLTTFTAALDTGDVVALSVQYMLAKSYY